MTEANILPFPKSKIVRETPPEQTNESLEKLKKQGIINYADAIATDLSGLVYLELSQFGIDTSSQIFEKDFVLLSAILKATIYRAMTLEHPLHQSMSDSVTLIKLEDDLEVDNAPQE